MSQIDTPAKEPVHIMVDIETLDTVPSAVILSIGACVISEDPTQITFYGELAIQQQLNIGRTKDEGTVAWWATQLNPPPTGTFRLKDTLIEFTNWIHAQSQTPIMWCKGTDFDVAILANAYKQLELPVPWRYSDVRDFRTVKRMFLDSVDPAIVNTAAHHALEDAIFQARQLRSIGLILK